LTGNRSGTTEYRGDAIVTLPVRCLAGHAAFAP
jgi:hypothetical protein